MSRVRTRPTRDETRDKLFEAAARMFEQHGIGGASIEAIAAAAGFTRGAFYSNFESKDELIIAMLEDHVAQSIQRNMDILAQHDDLDDFIAALKTMDRSRQDPLGRSPIEKKPTSVSSRSARLTATVTGAVGTSSPCPAGR